MPRKTKKEVRDIAGENFMAGVGLLNAHTIFSPLLWHAEVIRSAASLCPRDGWAIVTSAGQIHVHPTRRGQPGEWAYVLAHCLLHLGFGHFRAGVQEREWNAACCLFSARFLADLKFGLPPDDVAPTIELTTQNEERIYEDLISRFAGSVAPQGTAGPHGSDMILTPLPGKPFDWPACFGAGLVLAVSEAVVQASGVEKSALRNSPGQRARAWFMDNYPLLGALAAGFTIIEDTQICNRMQISVAAVDPTSREIYINPAAGLGPMELRFVMAHELLHVGLRHDIRAQGRDHDLWNVACDYVINAWLVDMRVGDLPRVGVLYDKELRGESAEAIYDRIAVDMRRFRKLATMRGVGMSDILEPRPREWWNTPEGCDLDEYYRRALSQGLVYHEDAGRGFLPAGLVEEIRALAVPPIPWDVALARWFDDQFPPLEKRRSYARPSRRQSATPDIPRPSLVPPWDELDARTFGVLLDTSGSMDRALLARALGAIASYSAARDVPAARVVFCDADAYDQGYMPPADIAGTVKVRGRGGTVLQPGIDLLEKADDFPKDGPLLIITDGKCDKLSVHREHAYLLPEGRNLPFVPRGKVFRIS